MRAGDCPHLHVTCSFISLSRAGRCSWNHLHPVHLIQNSQRAGYLEHRTIQTCERAFQARAECLFAATSHLDVADLQRDGASLWTHNVVMGSPPHLSLQGLKLAVDVWKLTLRYSTTLHLERHLWVRRWPSELSAEQCSTLGEPSAGDPSHICKCPWARQRRPSAQSSCPGSVVPLSALL